MSMTTDFSTKFQEMRAKKLPSGAAKTAEAASKLPSWPIVNDAALHGFAGDVVRTIEPHSEADPIAILIQLLAAAGNIIGRRAFYQVESDRHHANLFAVLVGQSSKARKGTSWGRVGAIGKVADPTWAETRCKGGLSSGEGLITRCATRLQNGTQRRVSSMWLILALPTSGF